MANGIEDQVLAIINSWSGKDASIMDTLANLWADTAAPFSVGAIKLAAMLNANLGSQIQSSDLSPATTVDDVIHMVMSELPGDPNVPYPA